MKLKKMVLALALSPLVAQAQMVPAVSPDPGQVQAINPAIRLNDKERLALELVREWKKNPDKPRRAADGSVKYLFGATLPTLICTPLQVCAIQLEPGEVVNDVHAGDASRWKITPAMVGSGQNAITNVVVKPTETGLVTNLIIATDRRSYTVQLKSAKHEWMPSISFAYPDEADRAWENYRAAQAKAAYGSTLASGESIENLDFNFRIDGDNPKWKPIRVYTNGTKTSIQFPDARFLGTEAPALVVYGKPSGFFKSERKEAQVNYRHRGDKYIVDYVPEVSEQLALILGVGNEQTKVTIEYLGGSK